MWSPVGPEFPEPLLPVGGGIWKSGRVVEDNGLLNRQPVTGLAGSNPASSEDDNSGSADDGAGSHQIQSEFVEFGYFEKEI